MVRHRKAEVRGIRPIKEETRKGKVMEPKESRRESPKATEEKAPIDLVQHGEETKQAANQEKGH